MPIGRSALCGVSTHSKERALDIAVMDAERLSSSQLAMAEVSMNNKQPIHTKRQYLRELVYQRNKWDKPLSEKDKANGFLGWHERGYLTHCDKPGLVQFLTLRLADSFPSSRRREWEHLLAIEDRREQRTKLEEYLDRGVGECHLRAPRIAKFSEEALLFFHNQRYELLAWCVMPNHVHALVHVWNWPLSKMVQSWKKRSGSQALAILRLERRSPDRRSEVSRMRRPIRRSALRSFWQREYWDTFMRDKDQEKTAIRYIENNPVKAKLCRTVDDWKFSSARFRDKYQRLVLPEES